VPANNPTTTGSSSSSSSSGNPTGGTTTGGGPIVEEPPGGTDTSGKDSFDHSNDPGESGQKDPFEILKERAEEGPPQIRTRLHSCTKLPYSTLKELLQSRGVNMNSAVAKSAAQLYATGGDALGVAKYDARESERYFHTTAGATKMFDIFVQAAPEIIANIGNPAMAPACTLNGQNKPMFKADGRACERDSLSCLIGRPATEDDEILCELMLSQAHAQPTASPPKTEAEDLVTKQNITVAAFLSAAHTCE
jgi:hypothetical protein